MRQIKFRAYIDGKMHYFDLHRITSFSNSAYAWDHAYTQDGMCEIWTWLAEGNTPDTYVGILDKNGKEIYEGDIVKVETLFFTDGHNKSAISEVIFDQGTFGIKDFYSGTRHTLKLMGLDREVIGNIYENPELLHES